MSEQLPPLLGTSQAEEILEILPSDMTSVTPHLHRLVLPGYIRLYPQAYIQGLNPAMRMRASARPSETARIFSGGEIAALAISAAEQELHDAITGRLVALESDDLENTEHGISISDLAAVLCFARSENVTYWVQDGYLTAIDQGGASYIGETSLRGTISWERPQSFPEKDHIADVVRVQSVTE